MKHTVITKVVLETSRTIEMRNYQERYWIFHVKILDCVACRDLLSRQARVQRVKNLPFELFTEIRLLKCRAKFYKRRTAIFLETLSQYYSFWRSTSVFLPFWYFSWRPYGFGDIYTSRMIFGQMWKTQKRQAFLKLDWLTERMFMRSFTSAFITFRTFYRFPDVQQGYQ